MGEVSAISWTDASFNPWIGCSRISTACDHCYAARDNEHRKWVDGWGQDAPRRRTSVHNWNEPRRWQRKAAASGQRPRVFVASLADVFDNHRSIPREWREDLWQLMRETPDLRWMILTKRIGNARRMLPPDWPFPHVGLMATIVTQQEWDRDWPKLKATPAPWRGVSIEPTLEPIDMRGDLPNWVITGGESGPGHRELPFNAVRFIRDQCDRAGAAYHHKQNGGVRGKDSGCLIDGAEHKGFPAALAA